MTRNKLLIEIGIELEEMAYRVQKLRDSTAELHKIDVDVLQNKTRQLYDKLIDLETNLDLKASENVNTIKLPEEMPEAAIPEVAESKKEESPGTVVFEINQAPETKKEETEVYEQVTERVEENIEPEPTAEIEKEPIPEETEVESVKPEPEPEFTEKITAEEKVEVVTPELPEETIEESIQEAEQKAAEETIEEMPERETSPAPAVSSGSAEMKAPQSTFDLFTASAEKTVADKFGNADDSSIAQKMQKSKISDLKQAIGINEKFLFINELFNGDLGRYNKAIDEFNELNTSQGVDTHLLELKIHNQWQDDNEAFMKLQSLLDRKFG